MSLEVESEYQNIERFILDVLDDRKPITSEGFEKVTEVKPKVNLWYSWMTDYTLIECFKRMSAISNLKTINLSGQKYITDFGIISIAPFLKQCKSLNKIDLSGCCQITDRSFSYLLNEFGSKPIEFDIRFTDINYLPNDIDIIHKNIKTNGYNRIIKYDYKISPVYTDSFYPIIIWPSKSVTVSGISILADKKSEAFMGNFLEHRRLKLSDDLPTINFLNFKLTEAPMHSFLTSSVKHIIILIPDESNEAENHIVESLAYFLSRLSNYKKLPSYQTVTGAATGDSDAIITDSRVPSDDPVMFRTSTKALPTKAKKVSKKTKASKSDFMENEIVISNKMKYDPLIDVEFMFQAISLKNKSINNFKGQTGYFISLLHFNETDRYKFTVNLTKSSNYLGLLKIGLGNVSCIKAKTPPNQNQPLILFDSNHKNYIITYEGKTHTFDVVNQAESIVFSILPNNVFNSSSKSKKLLSIEINDKPLWSTVLSTPDKEDIYPFIVMSDEEAFFVKLDQAWVHVENVQPKERTQVDVSEEILETQFTVMCYGKNHQTVSENLRQMKWIAKLQKSINKLKALIDTIKKKPPNQIDFKDQSRLSLAQKQCSNIEAFISDAKSRIEFFGFEEVNNEIVESILDRIKTNIQQACAINIHRYLPHKIYTIQSRKTINVFIQKKHKYFTESSIFGVTEFTRPGRREILLKLIEEDINALYLKHQGLYIFDIKWFDDLLKCLISDVPYESNLRAVGIDSSAKVWTESSLTELLISKGVKDNDVPTWLTALQKLGIFTKVPCLRYTIEDEQWFYTNPMIMSAAKQPHLETIKSAKSKSPKTITASIQFNKVNEDLYSLYPSLVSSIVSIGTLQLMSPVASTIHVTGGVELIVEAEQNSLSLTAYFPQYGEANSTNSGISQANILHLLWSIMYLCSDQLETLIIQQNLLVDVVKSTDNCPTNNSIGYMHNWSSAPDIANICSLCNNCSSNESVCQFNRISSRKRGHCICGSLNTKICIDCGICYECFNKFWKSHSIANPCRMMYTINNTLQPEAFPVSHLPKMTVKMLDYYQKSKITIKDLNRVESIELELGSVSASSIMQIELTFTKQLSSVTEDRIFYKATPNVYVFNDWGIMIFNERVKSGVGTMYGRYEFSKQRNKFSFEILNPGDKGTITIGVVPEQCILQGQPGWKKNAIGFHGDDGKVYNGKTSSSSPAYNFFSKTGNIVECEMVYDDSTSNREVLFRVNGEEMVRETINNNLAYYPAIGMHSNHEVIRFVDDRIWRDSTFHETPTQLRPLLDTESYPSVDIYPSSVAGIKQFLLTIVAFRPKKPLASIEFQDVENILEIFGKREMNCEIHGLTVNFLEADNQLPVIPVKVKIKSANIKAFKAKIKFTSGEVIEKTWKTDKDFLQNDIPNQQYDQSGYLVQAEYTYFHGSEMKISKYTKTLRMSSYAVCILENNLRVLVDCEEYVKPNFTPNFQVGNLVAYQNNLTMITGINGQQLKLTTMKSNIQSNDPLLSASIGDKFGSLLSLENYQNSRYRYYNLDKPNFLKVPPRSKPHPMLMESNEIRMNVFYIFYKCDEYHGLTVPIISNLSRSIFPLISQNPVTSKFIPLPFDKTKISEITLLLWEHSLIDLYDCDNYVYHFLCAGHSSLYDPIPHILDTEGVPTKQKSSDLYNKIFRAPEFLEAFKTLVNNKFILPRYEKMLPGINTDFSTREIEELTAIIIEKIIGFMIMNCLVCPDEKLYHKITKDDFPILQKLESPLVQDVEQISCQLHCSNSLDQLDLDNIESGSKEGENAQIDNPLFYYSLCSQSLILTGQKTPTIQPDFFKNFINIKSLKLRDLECLELLPNSVYEIRGLEELEINRLPSLKSLPDITRLPMLITVNITQSTAQNFDKIIPDQHSRLGELNITAVPIEKFPVEFCNFQNLKILKLKLIGLADLPDEIENLVFLKYLSITCSDVYYQLASNNISQTQRIGGRSTYASRKYLDLDIPELIKYQDVISKQYAFSTSVELLNPATCYRTVQRVGSKNNGKFPTILLKLSTLIELQIHHSALKEIPETINSLSNLETLDLSYNVLLENIHPNISNNKVLTKIKLTHCPSLKAPPRVIIERGSTATLSYLKFLRAEKMRCNRTKLMVVGLGEAGKTSLIKALQSSTNKVQQSDVESQVVTDGIDIGNWKIPTNDGNDLVQFSVWDFAGQDVYYNTHQFFLSSKSVYFVVWSVRQGIEHGDLDFWLSSIACHAKDAPVFVVGTRCDQVEIDQSAFITLKARYTQIHGFFLVDSFSGTGIQSLKTQLVEEAMKLPYITQDIPASIVAFEEKIVSLRSQKKYMDYEKYKEFAINLSILEDDVGQVTQILHDFGSIQYFDTDLLKNLVVIDPQWIVDVMANVVSVVNQTIRNGLFYHESMPIVWPNFDPNLYPWMMSLTEQFDLTFPHPTMEPKANIVPCLLSEDEPEIIWPQFLNDSKWKYLKINYEFDFLPAGLFNRIQVRLFEFTETKEIWKFGSYFIKNGHHVLLKRENKDHLVIRAVGVNPVNVLAILDEVIVTLIHSSFYGVHYKLKIPCPDCINEGKCESLNAIKYWSNVCMINSEVIRKAIDKRAEFIQCEELHLSSLKSLRDITPETAKPENFINDLQLKIQTVSTMATSSTFSAVLLCSNKDFPAFIDYNDLEKIFKQLNISVYKLNEELPKNWKKQISSSKLCITVLSENLLKLSSTMNEVHNYVMCIRKRHLLILTGKDEDAKKKWEFGMHFIKIFYKLDKSQKNKYTDSLVKLKAGIEDILHEDEISDGQVKKTHLDVYDCFISYCWANSQEAVNKGTREVKGAISCVEADPRALKRYLEEKGIRCWIDDSNLNQKQRLTTQLSKAIQNSKIMIAFISKQYGKSENCKMELLYMAETLKRPVIYVLVGTDYLINIESDIAMRIQNSLSPKLLEFNSPEKVDRDKLLQYVQETLQTIPDEIIQRKQTVVNTNNTNALDEQVELIFRQFLNHLIQSVGNELPRLLVLDDIETPVESKEEEKNDQTQELESQNLQEEQQKLTRKDTPSSLSTVCIRVLCEHEDGWHVLNQTQHDIPIPIEDFENLLSDSAMFMALFYQILQYNNPGLRCLQPHLITENKLVNKINELSQVTRLSMLESYSKLWNYVSKLGPDFDAMSFFRYRPPSGRVLWLCEKDASGHSRYKKLVKDSLATTDLVACVLEYDIELAQNINSMDKANSKVQNKNESNDTVTSLTQKPLKSIMKPIQRQDTSLMMEKKIIQSTLQPSIPIARPTTAKQTKANALNSSSKESTNLTEENNGKLLPRRRTHNIERKEIQTSVICAIQ